MLTALSRLLVGWVRFGQLPKFGPAPQINEIEIEKFLGCLYSGFDGSIEVFIVATKYLLRLHAHSTQEINFRHAFLTAMSLAYKFLLDDKPDSKLHAYVGGISAADLARLEQAFLATISFRLFVTGAAYNSILNAVENERTRYLYRDPKPYHSLAFQSYPTEPFRAKFQLHHHTAFHPYQQREIQGPPVDAPYDPWGQADSSQQWRASNAMEPWGQPDFHSWVNQWQAYHPPQQSNHGAEWISFIDQTAVDFSSWHGAVFP